MSRKRRGMIVKNTEERPVSIALATRTVVLESGQEQALTAEEVKDPVLREFLQVRAVSIVRPTTEAEEETLRQALTDRERADS